MPRMPVPRAVPSSAFRVGTAALLLIAGLAPQVAAWSNGGYSADPASPDYGTHDWIAEHALEWLPAAEKAYITSNRAAYLYGTELPDNGGAPDGIGDNTKHHVYYRAGGALQDDDSAVRASEEYADALAYLRAPNLPAAAKAAGIMTHYVVDVAVFGHVMGASTDWGAEVHHNDYEGYVTARMTGYVSTTFDPYLAFDGTLETVSAYDATLDIAYGTTFGTGPTKDCAWMDANYDWNDPAFRDSAGASLNRAVNALADVLHTLAVDAGSPPPPEADVTAPTVTIASPSDGDTLAATVLTVRGTASDNVAVQKIQVSADAVNWVDCSGTTAWNCTVTLHPGSNDVHVRATDTSENSGSATVRVTVSLPPGETGSPDGLPVVLAFVGAVLVGIATTMAVWRRRKR